MSAPSYQARVSYIASAKAIRRQETIRFRTSRNPEDYFWSYFVPSFLSEARDIKISSVRRSTRSSWRGQPLTHRTKARIDKMEESKRKVQEVSVIKNDNCNGFEEPVKKEKQQEVVYAPRLSFNISRKHYELMRYLPDDVRGLMLASVSRYGFDRELPKFDERFGIWKDAAKKMWDDFIFPDMRLDWIHYLSKIKDSDQQIMSSILDSHDCRALSFKQ